MIILFNLFILSGLDRDDIESFNSPTLFDANKIISGIVMYCLGVTILLGLMYFTIIQMWIAVLHRPNQIKEETSKRYETSFSRRLYLYMRTLRKRSLWWLILCILFSLFGLIVNIYWFSGWVLFLVNFNDDIMEVLRAIWQPKRRILVTFLLIILVLYVYSVLSFVLFDKDFKKNLEDSCNDAASWFVIIFDQWHKDGYGGFLSDAAPAISNGAGVYEAQWGRLIADFIFFLVVPTLLINILAGIIIDNFGERRSRKDTIRQRQMSQCYIWGVENIDIDDFDNHTKYKHNIWDYMYYIGYLKYMKTDRLVNSTDSYVEKCLNERKIAWFPCWKVTQD